jgi:hypothetical protein
MAHVEHTMPPFFGGFELPHIIGSATARALSTWLGDDRGLAWANAIDAVTPSPRERLLLASQAFVEGGFASWVLDGSCNDAAWRARQHGWLVKACDKGHAYGPWQIHDSALAGAQPAQHALEALRFLRVRPQAWTTWRQARAHAAWWSPELSETRK